MKRGGAAVFLAVFAIAPTAAARTRSGDAIPPPVRRAVAVPRQRARPTPLTLVGGLLCALLVAWWPGQGLGQPSAVLFADINQTPTGDDFEASSSPADLTDVNGTLFFRADDGTNGSELWKSDGTLAGTVLVKDIDPGGGN